MAELAVHGWVKRFTCNANIHLLNKHKNQLNFN
jgi:hypothetical protein